MDKTLETGYDIHLLCARIAYHVALYAIFLFEFWSQAVQDYNAKLYKGRPLQEFALGIYQFLKNPAVIVGITLTYLQFTVY